MNLSKSPSFVIKEIIKTVSVAYRLFIIHIKESCSVVRISSVICFKTLLSHELFLKAEITST